jgi:hypothetical protein
MVEDGGPVMFTENVHSGSFYVIICFGSRVSIKAEVLRSSLSSSSLENLSPASLADVLQCSQYR